MVKLGAPMSGGTTEVQGLQRDVGLCDAGRGVECGS